MNEAREIACKPQELPDLHRHGRYFPGSDRAALREALGISDAALMQLLADEKGMNDWNRKASAHRHRS
jgi:hypothetical protein